MSLLITSGRFKGFAADGTPLAGGRLYTYASGTTTQKNAYVDAGATTPCTYTSDGAGGLYIALDARGEALVFLGSGAYTLTLKTSAGGSVYSVDGVTGDLPAGSVTLAQMSSAVQALLNGAVQSDGSVAMSDQLFLAGNASDELAAVPLQQASAFSITSARALQISTTGTNSSVSILADEVIARADSGSGRRLSSVSVIASAAASGVNGLDTGSVAGSTWYSVWVISNGVTTASLLSLSATSPTMPTGYTFKARVGWIRTDSTTNKYPLAIVQRGRRAQYALAGALSAFPQMFFGTTSGAQAVAVGSFCPTTAGAIALTWGVAGTGSGAAISIGPSSAAAVATSSGFAYLASSSTSFSGISNCLMVLESSNIYVNSSNGNGFIGCTGWEDNL